MVVNINTELMNLGLSEYEARTYTALLEEHPLTAYETAGQAGIPTSKIYGVIRKLLERQLILEVRENAKKRYIPQDPEEFLSSYRYQINKRLNMLSSELKKPRESRNLSFIWNLKDMDQMMEKAERMILEAEDSILLSVWEDEYKSLEPFIDKKTAEGVKSAIVHFGPVSQKKENLFHHPIEDTLYQEKGGRGFTLVTDSSSALSGTISESGPEGAWSRNRGFVTMAEDYIKHDIYIMKMVERFEPQMIKTFGEGYSLLRDIFHNREEKEDENIH